MVVLPYMAVVLINIDYIGVLDKMYKREGDFKQRSFAPVKVGDILEVKIEAVGEKGDGIAKVKGFVLFVPNAKKDETIKVKVTRVLRKVGFAEIVGSESSSAESEEAGEESYEQEDSYKEEEQSSGESESQDSGNSEDSEEF